MYDGKTTYSQRRDSVWNATQKYKHSWNSLIYTRVHSHFDWSVCMETAAACYTYTRSIHALDIFSFSLDAIQHWAVCFLLLFPFTLYVYISISMYSRKIYIYTYFSDLFVRVTFWSLLLRPLIPSSSSSVELYELNSKIISKNRE